jgi:glutamate/tyrosine decarboxylase-like PLP-dependent enzyme
MDNKALFIGPYGENADEFRKMISNIMDDIIQWRRNFHPSEERLIQYNDKDKPEWKRTMNSNFQELDKLLGELKGSVPFHNPRFIGHMHSDLAMPALLGYFAGQLYNQNNIVGESSPVTTEKEMMFIEALCKMVGYEDTTFFKTAEAKKKPDACFSSGHTTSGGTTANIEALWTARNIKYYPISLKILLDHDPFNQNTAKPQSIKPNSEEFKELMDKHSKITKSEWKRFFTFLGQLRVTLPNTESISLIECNYEELFNLTPKSVFELRNQLNLPFSKVGNEDKSTKKTADSIFPSSEINISVGKTFDEIIKFFDIRSLGVYGIHSKVNCLKMPILVIPQTSHYSWDKAMDIVGFGTSNVRKVKVDNNFGVISDEFEKEVDSKEPILMAVGIVGTTEEGAIDPILNMLVAKQKMEKKGRSFFFHVDAAYGGYFSSMIRPVELPDNASDAQKTANNLRIKEFENLISYRPHLDAMKDVDSITIDPHKLGFVPYAIGAILYKNSKCIEFNVREAPYLSIISNETGLDDPAQAYLGGPAIEGSKSGAAALAGYLTTKVIPLDQSGYGQLIKNTILNATLLHRLFESTIHENKIGATPKIAIQSLSVPQSNILCYSVGVPEFINSLEDLNEFNELLFNEMSARRERKIYDFEFIVSKTDLAYKHYSGQIKNVLDGLRIVDKSDLSGKKLQLIRTVLMNPIIEANAAEKLFKEYVEYLDRLSKDILPKLFLKILAREDVSLTITDDESAEKRDKRRLPVYWIENNDSLKQVKDRLETGFEGMQIDISKHIDLRFVSDNLDFKKIKLGGKAKPPIFIVDLNLVDRNHTEWISGIGIIAAIIKECIEKKVSPKIIIYSQFLNPKEDHPKLPEILRGFFKSYANIEPYYALAKSRDGSKISQSELNQLVNAIYHLAVN